MMRRRSVLSLAAPVLLTALASCTGAPEAPPPPAAPAVIAPAPAAPPLAADWRDWPVTPGIWVYRADRGGSVALFGPPGQDALATLRCDPVARRVTIARAGAATTPLTIRTSSATRSLGVARTGDTLPYVAAALAATDPLLDAMAFSRGRFTIEQAGAAPLAIPAWAEVGRVIEDCRG